MRTKNLFDQGVQSPEAQVLLACVRSRYSARHAAELPEALQVTKASGFDWACLLQQASDHAILPLLSAVLLQNAEFCAGAGFTPALVSQLKTSMRRNALHSMNLTGEMLAVAQELGAAHLPFLFFKGPMLVEEIYGGEALRQFADLDVLVPRREVLRARALLQGRGYTESVPLSPGQEAAFLREDTVMDLQRAGQYFVELHWKLSSPSMPFCCPFEELESSLTTIEVGGKTVPALKPEALLLILSIHGSKHLWCRLSWICDVAQLFGTYPNLDWERILELAKRWRCRPMLSMGLLVAQEVAGLELPEHMLTWANANRQGQDLASRVVPTLVAGGEGQGTNALNDYLTLRMLETWGDRARYMTRVLTVPNAKERETVKLHNRLAFLWRIIRPARLVVKYARLLVHGAQASRLPSREKVPD